VSEPEIVVVADPEAASAAAAEGIAEALRAAVEARGRADWATTGGSTPVGIYARLAAPAMADAVPWSAVHTWWGDDRFVPRDHPLSNVKPLDDVLLDIGGHAAGTAAGGRAGLHVAVENLHPFRTSEAIGAGLPAAACASELAVELRAAGLPEAGGWPVLDLVLLGLGPDGHVLSVFPGSAAFDSPLWALDIPAPTHVEPHVERVTLNPAIVTAARKVLVVSYGAGKAEVLASILGPVRDVRRWPAQIARRDGATWILDEAAAANLSRS
jgi:6-phosphogluconolactonase